jgi:succinate-semialdehyde dehydrogenase / glutarate-semialdehyde dehydrogenase
VTTSTWSPPPVLADFESYVSSLQPDRGVRISGRRLAAADESRFVVIDPATGGSITMVANGAEAEARQAVDAASAASCSWAATAPRRRSEVLRAAFDLMHGDLDRLAALVSRENGKALRDARAEVRYAAEFLRWFSEEAVRAEGSYAVAPDGGSRTIVTHRPVGVAALVTPWNFPAAMATRKIAPALAAGCSVVLKPSEETPLTALAIHDILLEAGVPDGVVNVVPTVGAAEVVSTWLSDERVRAVSFTGSTPVGKKLLHQAADRVVNAAMELGGNAPFVVADDADVDAAVAGALVAKFRNGGQACTAANRFFVHRAVVDDFCAGFGEAIAAMVVGPGWQERVEVGPLVNERALLGVRELVDAAVGAGATITHRAAVPEDGVGYFYPPMLLRDVAADSPLMRTEVFGPVAAVTTWGDEDELLAAVNGTESGLAAYVYSTDLKRALQLAEQMDAGMVGINRGVVSDPSAPFGGVKQSGLGREGAREGVREFQETQYFSVDWS